jgi:hypothetical protein
MSWTKDWADDMKHFCQCLVVNKYELLKCKKCRQEARREKRIKKEKDQDD